MNDEYYMQLALNLARSVSGQTSPNPPVGAVVVKHGRIVGMGAHLKAGEAHAEVHALEMAGDKAEGATIYVTLEPCSHYGSTPPCADLICDRGVQRAVIATTDPNEKVAGRGIEKLRAADVAVELGVLEKEAAAVNSVFFHYTQTKKPFVTMKSATSLDGKTATYTGESKWITGEAARRDVHYYRHSHDAILVGVNTVIADNPSLTARIPYGRNPLRIILDRHLRTPVDANLITDQQADTWIFTDETITETDMAPFSDKPGVRIIRLEDVTPDAVLTYLGSKGIMSVFVEGGATVNDAFLRSGAINQLIQYMAAKLIGGKDAPTSIGGSGLQHIDDTPPLEVSHVEMIGEDIKVIAKARKDD